MDKRIHVLFLMEDLCYGGTQRQTLQIAVRLDKTRFRVSMVTLTGKTDLDSEAIAGGLELSHIGRSRAVDPLFFLKLPGVLRRLRPDVVVPCTALPNIWARIWGRMLRPFGGPSIVGTVRGGGAPVRQHERFLHGFADHVICNSEALHGIMRGLGVPSEKISYIPNGVNTDLFAPAEPAPSKRPARISCLARLCRDKDQATLISAFEIVARDHPEAILRLVGDGPMEADVRARVEKSPYADRMELLPGEPDVRSHYACTRIFALSSIREGQPNVLLEAMACGLPVCATAVGGIPRLVKEGVNGYLTPAGDSRAFAASLLRLLEDGDATDVMGRANRERALADFSFSPAVAAHEAVFERLAHSRAR